MAEKVNIINVEDSGRKTGAGDPVLRITLEDGRIGTGFDARFLDLDLLDIHEITVRSKGMFQGKEDLVFNLPKDFAHKAVPIQEQPNTNMGEKTYLDEEPSKALWGEKRDNSEPFVKAEQRQEKAKEAPKQEKAKQEKQGQGNKAPWQEALDKARLSIIKLTGKEKETAIEMDFAMQAIQANPELKSCSPDSIINAVINIVRTGITLNPVLQLAYLIKRKGECTLEFSYRGLVKILKDFGCVRDIQAVIVYKDEEYEEGIAQTDRPVHKKHYPESEEEENKRKVLGVYCRVVLPPDNLMVFTPLKPYWEILKAEKMSPSSGHKDSTWRTWRQEKIKITKLKADFKTLVSGSTETRAALYAIMAAMDSNDVETGLQVYQTQAGKGSVSQDDATDIFGEKPKALNEGRNYEDDLLNTDADGITYREKHVSPESVVTKKGVTKSKLDKLKELQNKAGKY